MAEMDEAVKHSVLLVDDEPEILFSLKSLLRRDFDLHTAECGEEALRILSQQPIHIVMSDQRMPNMSGTELMEKVRIAYPNTIRIIFTGYADSKAVVDSVNRCEVYRYITKPWDPDELIDILHVAAKKHDIVAERHQIHLDLQRHLARNQTWTQRVRDGQSLSAASLSIELNECLAETAQLAQRLDRIIDEENTASGDHPSPLNE